MYLQNSAQSLSSNGFAWLGVAAATLRVAEVKQ
jgi:hypothetical protein|nr:MAG TPA: hypothetical protein [Caudoviricetes sp.]